VEPSSGPPAVDAERAFSTDAFDFHQIFDAVSMWAKDAESRQDESVDWLRIGSCLVGGVCLLSFSMSLMSRSLRNAFGTSLRAAIKAACYNRVTAFLTGTVATAILTSATATSLLTLSFVQAGDMTLAQALGISLGINVGSTLNAHLVAIQIQKYGLAFIGVGYLMSALTRAPRPQHVGESLVGLGLLFQSISAIAEGIAPLRFYKPFLAVLARMSNPGLALLTSAACAVLFQSSNTVIAIAIMLGQQGFLPLHVAVYFVLGANVGTCFTSIIAALNQRRESMRVAVAYLLLKLLGVLLLLPLLTQFVWLIDASTTVARLRAEEKALADAVSSGLFMSPDAAASPTAAAADAADDSLSGVQTLELIRESARRAVLPVQIANAHTLVNLFIAVLFMPFLGSVAQAMVLLMPDDTASKRDQGEARGAADDAASLDEQSGAGGAGSGPDRHRFLSPGRGVQMVDEGAAAVHAAAAATDARSGKDSRGHPRAAGADSSDGAAPSAGWLRRAFGGLSSWLPFAAPAAPDSHASPLASSNGGDALRSRAADSRTRERRRSMQTDHAVGHPAAGLGSDARFGEGPDGGGDDADVDDDEENADSTPFLMRAESRIAGWPRQDRVASAQITSLANELFTQAAPQAQQGPAGPSRARKR
jgi:Na/Pi-cotransporter